MQISVKPQLEIIERVKKFYSLQKYGTQRSNVTNRNYGENSRAANLAYLLLRISETRRQNLYTTTPEAVMKRFAKVLAFSAILLGPIPAHALSVSINGADVNPGDSNSSTSITTYLIAGTYGEFTITNFGTGGARVESVEGSTDRLNLTGLSVKNNGSTTQTITITYSDLFNSTASTGYAGQQLSGAFSQASTSNVITSAAFTGVPCSGEFCPASNPIDSTSLFDGTLTATNRLSFGPLRETEGVNICDGSSTDCYFIAASTTITLLPGRFVNLAGSHDIMLIEGAIDDSGIIADFDAHQAEFHASEVPEPASILLLLSGLGLLGYFVTRKRMS